MFYFHIRNRDEYTGEILPKGGYTFICEPDGDTLKWSFAICSKKDNYNKKLGRLIAESRMNGVFGRSVDNDLKSFDTNIMDESEMRNFATYICWSLSRNKQSFLTKDIVIVSLQFSNSLLNVDNVFNNTTLC